MLSAPRIPRSDAGPRPDTALGSAPPRRLLALSLVILGLIALPVALTVIQAVIGDRTEISDALAGQDLAGSLGRTILLALVVTPICGIVGVAGAWLVERTSLPLPRLWALLLVAPITIPLFVTSYAWASLGPAWHGFAGGAGITAASYSPIVFLLTSAALRGMDPALEESARSLGCGPWRIFARVVLPQLRPALLGGLLIVALDTLVEFDAFVGIHYSIFITDIYAQYRVSFSASGAAALSCCSIALCVVVLIIERLWRGGAGYSRVSHGAARPPARYALGGWMPVALGGLLTLVLISVGIPVIELLSWASQSTAAGLAGAPASVSDLPQAAAGSVLLGGAAAVLAMALALPLAMLATRYRGVLAGLIERGSYLAFALPDLVAAIALSAFASHYLGPLYESVVLLVFAYAILFVPIGAVATRVSMGQLEPGLEEVSRSLGLGPLRTLWRVTLPLLRPGLAAAGVLVFAFVLSDLSTTQVLLPPGMVTLGTQFAANSSAVALGAAAPYAAALMLLALIAAYILMSRFGRTRLREAA